MTAHQLFELRKAFACDHKFYNDEKFPRGFSRSGHFTLLESEILEEHGRLLKALQEKTVEPINDIQAHFVAATTGVSTPINPVEKAWIKYLKLTTSKARFFTLFGRKRSFDAPEVEVEIDSDDLD
ncbi:hypothetical protein W04_0537 [Pseudoalteromonas sp. SW0106-04]|uniref:DUF413 domain-containing protein n=1 Tax=Pseudoalteromonas sp. SW0106-04 TaxID=1702169 RepID=UPI0006B4B1BB|nr:DUF413 domain-containing protein [Pseudoalteromonas sp. SW0106-04]GAP74026.1 hypothetical protein W04_0537 [Pseudoalteromonas sp. SW0106-04]